MSTGMNDRERAKAWFEARGVDCSGQAFSDFPIFSTLEAEFAAVRQEQHERTKAAAAKALLLAPAGRQAAIDAVESLILADTLAAQQPPEEPSDAPE